MEETLQFLLSQATGGAQLRRNREQMIEHLNSDDETLQMQALFQLCDELNMASPLGLTTLQPGQLVDPIIGCLQKEHNPDMMLLAARALTYLADSLPRTLSVLAEPKNTNALLDPLRNMTEIELSEQCLTCLEKLSQTAEGARAIFQASGIGALLMFIDFFTISSQRKAWISVQRACRGVTAHRFDTVVDMLPAMRQAVGHGDSAIRQSALSSLTTIARNVSSKPDYVEQVFDGFGSTLATLTALSEVKADGIFTAILALVQVGVHSSANVTKSLIKAGVMRNFFALLDAFLGGATTASPLPEPAALARSRSGSPSQTGSPLLQMAADPILATSTGARTATAAPTRPTTQQVTAMAAILSNAVGLNRTGLLGYMDTLLKLQHTTMPSRTTNSSNTDQEDDEEGIIDTENGEQSSDDDYEDIEEDDDAESVEEESNTSAHPSTQLAADEEGSAAILARRERVAASGVSLVSVKQRVNVDNHSCDGCQKPKLEAGDWYRCNQCPDCDYCADCVQKLFLKHARGKHTFTDVAVLFGAEPVAVRCSPSKPSQNELSKVAMYNKEPALLLDLLEGLTTMIALATEAESTQVVLPTTSFIVSLCAHVSAQQLQQCKLEESKIHDVILAQLASPHLWANLLAVSLVTALLDKLNVVMVPKLMREGVTDALVQLQTTLADSPSRSGPPPRTADKDDWSTKLSSTAGWKEAIALECTKALGRFPALKDEKRAEQLRQVSEHLTQNKMQKAAELLRDVLNSGVTTFELSAGSLVSDIRQAWVRANSIHAIMTFMVTLCGGRVEGGSAGQNTALHSLIEHLRSLQARMNDSLKVDTPTAVIDGHISLRIEPHESDASPRSRPGASQPSDAASSKGKTASVSVDPFVTISDLSEFVEKNLAPRSDALSVAATARRHLLGRPNDDDSDGVENILPDLHSTVNRNIRGKSFREAVSPIAVGAPTSTAAAAEAASPSVGTDAQPSARYWLRCGSHVLPPSMTVLQVMERFARHNHGRGNGQTPKHLLPPSVRRQPGNEEATLFYSREPFNDKYKIVSGAARLPALAVSSPIDLRLPSVLRGPASAGETIKNLNSSFTCSKRFLSRPHQDVLAVLGALHEALAHWSELLRYTHPELVSDGVTAATEAILSPNVPSSAFESRKLNHKALRLCCDPRVAGLHTATWPVSVELDAPFLFPPSTRELLFSVAFCGTARSLVRMNQFTATHGAMDGGVQNQSAQNQMRLPKIKKRVWRDHPLECAMAVLGDRRSSGSVMWEFQFYHEEGSGLGPTREFYTLVSQALRKRSLKLWLEDDSQEENPDELVAPLNGLYPRPLAADSADTADTVKYFAFMGRLVARALLDGHVPMLALSTVFLKLVRSDVCGLSDVEQIMPSVYTVLRAMADATASGSNTLALGKNGCTVESLFLTFTLPGNDAVELVPGGAQKDVTTANMGEYCDLVVDWLLNRGVQKAVEAFRAGFDDYMPVAALCVLTRQELFLAIHGNETPVTRADMEAFCRADHGFTSTCKHVQWFYDIVTEFSLEEQRQFFQFLTGSPHLPVGGLASLRPPLTIVRKVATDQSVMEGEQLPSAMTCQNYLKLPAYDTKEQMTQKLRQAMQEGVGAFLLT